VIVNAARDFKRGDDSQRLAPGAAEQPPKPEEARPTVAGQGSTPQASTRKRPSDRALGGAAAAQEQRGEAVSQDRRQAPAAAADAPPGPEEAAAEAPQDAASAPQEAPAAEEEAARPVAEPPPEESPAALRDRWLRTAAELDNQRKRYERLLGEVRLLERDRVMSVWLPIMDHLELALRHADADPKSIVAGVEAVQRQALAALEGLGYHRFAEVGEVFDPARHEAAQARETPDAEPGTIVEVMRPGYSSDDHLLRPAVVAVAKQPE
jgi:molecular chaperone GrpE